MPYFCWQAADRLVVLRWGWWCFCLILLATSVHARPPPNGARPVEVYHPPPDPQPYLLDAIPPGENFIQDDDFNNAAYGLFVNRTFKTNPSLLAPRLNFERPFTDECDDGSYIFITPRGPKTLASAAILDLNGSLIWKPDGWYGQLYNFQVVIWKGKQYIVYWGGNDSVGGHGAGIYYMFDQNYNLVRNVTAVEGAGADLHTFTVLPDDNVLLSVFAKAETDLTSVLRRPSPTRKWIWDARFQEFDLETGELIFEWHAMDHFPLTDSYTTLNAANEDDPWDWFHINMIEKDALGNYLITARHLRCIAYINGTNGDVIWRLGGKRNSFTDLSDHHDASSYVGMHDAHWDYDAVDNGKTYITLFDNRADWELEVEHVSRGKRVEVDLNAMTVRLNTTFTHPRNIFAFSQGSYQTLPNHNVLLGYGYSGAVTEFAPNGTALCDAYLQPASRFSSGDVQSYRNMKYNWTGIPLTPPAAVHENGTVYVSWFGSTEVKQWQLQESKIDHDSSFRNVVKSPKTGFETLLVAPASHGALLRYLRVIALDAQGKQLAMSETVDITYTPPPPPPPIEEVSNNSTSSEEQDLTLPPSNDIPTTDASTAPSAPTTGAVDTASTPSPTSLMDKPTPASGNTEDAAEYDDEFDDYDMDQALMLFDDIDLLFGLAFIAMAAALILIWFTFGRHLLGRTGFMRILRPSSVPPRRARRVLRSKWIEMERRLFMEDGDGG